MEGLELLASGREFAFTVDEHGLGPDGAAGDPDRDAAGFEQTLATVRRLPWVSPAQDAVGALAAATAVDEVDFRRPSRD